MKERFLNAFRHRSNRVTPVNDDDAEINGSDVRDIVDHSKEQPKIDDEDLGQPMDKVFAIITEEMAICCVNDGTTLTPNGTAKPHGPSRSKFKKSALHV